MDLSTIDQYENDKEIIEKYVKKSAFGKSKWIYLPLLVCAFSLIILILCIVMGMLSQLGSFTIIILVSTILVCIILMFLINRRAYLTLKKETSYAPICIAQKIYGNPEQNVGYAIYTCGEKRHDREFINRIAQKIFEIEKVPSLEVQKQINQLFKKDFVKPGEFAKLLPLSFTENIPVWRRQFFLPNLEEKENFQFPVVVISEENAKIFKEFYLS